VQIDLYHGTSGILLFLLAMHEQLGDDSYMTEARATADDIAARVPLETAPEELGLYADLPGAAIALAAIARAANDARYRDVALALTLRIAEAARPVGAGVQWNEIYDASYGVAGGVLFLLHMATELEGDAIASHLVELAARAGDRLIQVAVPEGGGVKWPIDAQGARWMPNFGHGTAGVAYALATLYRRTGKRAFLDAAIAGARYLSSVARRDGGVFLVFHADPDGLDRYYLSWCHGPPGTGRLLYQLAEATGDASWRELLTQAAQGVLTSGLPRARTTGYWNNVGQCCGAAGIAEFMMSLWRVTGEDRYLAFAREMMDDVLARATRHADNALSWTHAEHRVRPGELTTQTGYMQGAAGIGAAFLQLDAIGVGRTWSLRQVDSPFPTGRSPVRTVTPAYAG
jgi:lantibiotic modifying enzyme